MVSPIVCVSLKLSCSRVPHTRSIATFTSSATWRGGGREVDSVKRSNTLRHKHDLKKLFFILASPAACMICWGSPPSQRCESKHTRKQINRSSLKKYIQHIDFLLESGALCGYSPVEELVVDVLGSVHVGTNAIYDLNQLLQLLLQSLRRTASRQSTLSSQQMKIKAAMTWINQ